jgi:hypothetical protein
VSSIDPNDLGLGNRGSEQDLTHTTVVAIVQKGLQNHKADMVIIDGEHVQPFWELVWRVFHHPLPRFTHAHVFFFFPLFKTDMNPTSLNTKHMRHQIPFKKENSPNPYRKSQFPHVMFLIRSPRLTRN